jgi:16S rRNA (cytosine1402-N4)-methyltransferase
VTTHVPVMLRECLDELALRPGGLAVDGTLGHAGHGRPMAEAVGATGTFLGFDWDETMLDVARASLADLAHVELHRDDYRAIPERLAGRLADGVLLDMGLNSAQIEDPARGISFLRPEAPLMMLMDKSRGETAAAFLNRSSLDEITDVLHDLGDERWARAIAREILARRKNSPLRTVGDLVACVEAAIPPRARDKRIHPATRTFQAVRIAVNRELEDLEEALVAIAGCLSEGGRLVVLTYHSGEDRAAKRAFRQLAREGYSDRHSTPLRPSEGEIAANPRARSAKLRSLERTARTH